MATDLKLGATTHDLVIESGDLALATENEEVKQHVKIRLMFWQGEWILDFAEGLDWLDGIFTVHTSQEKRDKLIKDVITGTPTVKDLIDFVFDMDTPTHSAKIDWQGTTIFGPIVQEIRT